MTDILSRLKYSNPYLVDPTPEESRKLWRAIMLAPNLETCEALLKGQQVPKGALDFVWARRFGL